MVFSDLFFLYVFIPIFFICYNFFEKNKVLCIFSLIFYFFGEPKYILLLIFEIIINYYFAIKIEDTDNKKKKYLFLVLAIDLLILFIFKYLNFITRILFVGDFSKFRTRILLPLGISFYTFQAISYVVDVYRGEVKAQRSFKNLFLYISMFPQLIAGPIVRYSEIKNDIEDRYVTNSEFLYGIYRFVIGLGKKVIISNQLAVIVSSLLGGDLFIKSKCGLIIGIFIYMLQLYFDFSGYSDMAIGIGSAIGFKFNENFNYPFLSKSLTEFWRRWHISLGSFFRDYVYIPLGGNKKNQILNIIIVWFLTGIWHGADVNFLLWGVYLAVLILLEKYFILNILNGLNEIFSRIYFLIIIFFSFVLFYNAENYSISSYFMSLFGNTQFIDLYTKNILLNNIFLIVASIILSFPISSFIKKYVINKSTENEYIFLIVRVFIILFILIYSTILLVGNTSNPFLYFRF